MSKYLKSEKWLKRAEVTIPLGSQTFSKSRTQYPVGISPLYVQKGKGAHIWDIDGNRYLDLVGALAAVTIGYSDKAMNRVIRKQLKSGITLSLPGILEAEVAEKLIELIPSAEMVRFGKNGSDATSAAVRLARAYTGRSKIVVCGYHGWQDWYIGSTSRNKGVPSVVSDLTVAFKYNDLNELKTVIQENRGKIAALVMEPMNTTFPNPEFLQEVRKITENEGIVLVFDETITGFRFSKGGAQELFGVKPDLSTFGKGIANGMPLSAIVGKREIMLEMEEIFFSGTFGGELLSLASAKHVLSKVENSDLIEKLSQLGNQISDGVNELIKLTGLQDVLQLSGHPSWIFLNWSPTTEYSVDQIKTLFLQEMFDQNILILNSHNVSYSITGKDIKQLLKAYKNTLFTISDSLAKKDLQKRLKVDPLPPLFKLR
jgi:glutamate-1-semialdehyde 2,1-aminomutase